MSRVINLLEKNHQALRSAIEDTRERIHYMNESLAREEDKLTDLTEEADAIVNAIGMMRGNEVTPTRLEGSD